MNHKQQAPSGERAEENSTESDCIQLPESLQEQFKAVFGVE